MQWPLKQAQFLHGIEFAEVSTFATTNAGLEQFGPFGIGLGRALAIPVAIKSFEDLEVWQLSMQLSERVAELTTKLPARERYGLATQLRRAAISIPSNIAEGWSRPTRVYINHLRMALGSEAEVKTQLSLAVRMKYLEEADIADAMSDASQIGRMLQGLIRSLRRHLDNPH